ncbi:MAG: hypothetical protein AAGU74_08415 [Bacillota bacterium]
MKKQLSSEFKLIPEGEQVVRITKVDESEYAKFQKITVHIEDVEGNTARVNFNFVNDDGTANDIAEGVYARMCRAALDDQTLDEVDTEDLIGRFVTVEIQHNEGSKGGTFSNVKKWLGAGEPFKVRRQPAADAKKAANKSAAAKGAPPKKTAAEILAEMKAKKAAAR